MGQDTASLSHALAESGMSRVAKDRWVDLRRCVCVEHRPGEFQIQSPPEAAPRSRITLDWQPGCLWLLESFQGSEDAAIILPLPSVRHPQYWAVPEPTSSQPLRPKSYPEWQAHCQPTISLAEQAQARSAKQAADDEEALMVAAMAEIQTRRLKPKDHPDQTIAEALEALAVKLRTQALSRATRPTGSSLPAVKPDARLAPSTPARTDSPDPVADDAHIRVAKPAEIPTPDGEEAMNPSWLPAYLREEEPTAEPEEELGQKLS